MVSLDAAWVRLAGARDSDGITPEDPGLMTPDPWKIGEGAGVPLSKNPAKPVQAVKGLMRLGGN